MKILIAIILLNLNMVVAQVDPLPSKISFSVIIKPVYLFFSTFADKDGCIKGKIINKVLQKIIDQNIEAEKVCFNKVENVEEYDLNWILAVKKDFISKKLKLTFNKIGALNIKKSSDKSLVANVSGLKFDSLKNSSNIFFRITRFKIKEIKIDEPSQMINVKLLAANFIGFTASGGIQYYLDHKSLEYFKILGHKFKFKKRHKNI